MYLVNTRVLKKEVSSRFESYQLNTLANLAINPMLFSLGRCDPVIADRVISGSVITGRID